MDQDAFRTKYIKALRETYCGSIGIEYMHISNMKKPNGCNIKWNQYAAVLILMQ